MKQQTIALIVLAGVAFTIGGAYGIAAGLGLAQAAPAAIIGVCVAVLIRHRVPDVESAVDPRESRLARRDAELERRAAELARREAEPEPVASLSSLPVVASGRVTPARIPLPYEEK